MTLASGFLSIRRRTLQSCPARSYRALFLFPFFFSLSLRTQEPGRGISLYWSLLMKTKKLSLIIVMLSLAGCGGNNGSDAMSIASAESAATSPNSTLTNVAAEAQDSSQFLMDAYRDGLNEIQLSQLALQKSANNDVRSFAQRMIDHHTRMNAEITQLAQSKNIALPTDLSAEQKAQVNSLAALSGEEFDRTYMADNVVTHEKDVAAAGQQTLQGSDTDVRMLADVSLPILEVHLAVAKEINSLLDPSAFLIAAYQDGLEEIQLSQLALQKATDNDVRQFAQQMVDDHTMTNARIATLAQQKGISVPSAVTPEQQAAIDELARFSGTDFDKAYMDKNVIIHVKDVRQARQQSEQGRDPDVMNFAQQTLPVLASHLGTAIDIDLRIEPSFLYSASQDGKAEIQLAHLALMQSSNEQVRAYAQQMITDHTTANTQIMQLAQQRNIALPTEMSAEQLRAFVELMGESGAEFDREYMDVNVRIHRKDVAATTEQSQGATDADVRTFAQNALTVLTAHLVRAREIQQQLNVSAQS
jgi:predicted outer membrane protein